LVFLDHFWRFSSISSQFSRLQIGRGADKEKNDCGWREEASGGRSASCSRSRHPQFERPKHARGSEPSASQRAINASHAGTASTSSDESRVVVPFNFAPSSVGRPRGSLALEEAAEIEQRRHWPCGSRLGGRATEVHRVSTMTVPATTTTLRAPSEPPGAEGLWRQSCDASVVGDVSRGRDVGFAHCCRPPRPSNPEQAGPLVLQEWKTRPW